MFKIRLAMGTIERLNRLLKDIKDSRNSHTGQLAISDQLSVISQEICNQKNEESGELSIGHGA